MNKAVVTRAVASAIAAVAVVGAGISVYQSSTPPKLLTINYNGSSAAITPKDFVLPSFVQASDFGTEEVTRIQKGVCGGIGKEEWIPQKVVFAYLEPTETVYRIPCGVGQAGYFFRSFFITSIGPEIIDEYHPNSQSLFDIISPQQAAEYVMYFDIVRAGELGNKQFIITESQYDKLAEQCIHDNNSSIGTPSSSAVKALTIITPSGSKDHIVKLNFVNNRDGSFEYREYHVTRDGTITLLTEKILGNCNNTVGVGKGKQA